MLFTQDKTQWSTFLFSDKNIFAVYFFFFCMFVLVLAHNLFINVVINFYFAFMFAVFLLLLFCWFACDYNLLPCVGINRKLRKREMQYVRWGVWQHYRPIHVEIRLPHQHHLKRFKIVRVQILAMEIHQAIH